MDTLAFRLLLAIERRLFVEALGADTFARLQVEGRRNLAAMLPRVPDTGRPGARPFLVATCWLVAVHRALPERSAAENGALVARAVDHLFSRVPRPLRALRRWIFFQPWYYRRLVAGILGDAPHGFGGALVEEAPGRFGVDYRRCAIQTFLAEIGASELGPHECALDFVESRAFGLGLERAGTLATGATRCDFRWDRSRGVAR